MLVFITVFHATLKKHMSEARAEGGRSDREEKEKKRQKEQASRSTARRGRVYLPGKTILWVTAPVSVPTPDPAAEPLAFRFPTPTPAAGQYPLGTASFRYPVADRGFPTSDWGILARP